MGIPQAIRAALSASGRLAAALALQLPASKTWEISRSRVTDCTHDVACSIGASVKALQAQLHHLLAAVTLQVHL